MTENLFLYVWVGVIGGLNFLLFLGYGMNIEEWAKDTIARIINTITLFGILFYFSATKVSKQYDPVLIFIYLLNIFVLLLLGADNKSKLAIVITILIPIMIVLRFFGILPLRYLLWCIIDGLGGELSPVV